MILPVKPSWRSVSAHTRAATPARDTHLSPLTRDYGVGGRRQVLPEKTAAAHSISGEDTVQTTPLTSPQKQHRLLVEKASPACVLHPQAAFKILEESNREMLKSRLAQGAARV